MGCFGKGKTVVVSVETNKEKNTAPERRRSCTDVVFLIFFLAALVGVGYITFLALRRGDPGRYIHGVDSWGNVCSRKENKNIENATNSGLDRSNHTKELNLFLSDLQLLLNPNQVFSGKKVPVIICVHECPTAKVTKCSDLLKENGYEVDTSTVQSRVCKMPGGMIFQHEAVMNRCVPKQLVALGQGIAQVSLATAGAMADAVVTNQSQVGNGTVPKSTVQHMHDVITSITTNWQQILYLILMSIGISLGIIVLLQLFTRVLVILIIVIAGLGTSALTSYFWYHYLVVTGVIVKGSAESVLQNISLSVNGIFGASNNLSSELLNSTNLTNSLAFNDLHTSEYLLPIAILSTILTLLSWIILIWTRKSLSLVVKLFDEASRAMFSMPGMLFQPLVTVIFLLITLTGFLVISAFLLSDQTPSVDEDGLVYYVDRPGHSSGKILFVPVVFVFLWMLEFITACHQIILAGAVSGWFFTRSKKSKCNMCPTISPTWDLIRFNLGSAALGSLIVAFIQFLRIVLAYIQRKLKRVNNKAAKFAMKCLACCLACFEKVIKYVNRNAYICIAMYGEGFCASAKRAMGLLISNYQHVLALNCMTGFCLLLGSVSVVAVVGAIAATWFGGRSATDLEFLVPVIVSCVGAYFISRCFMSLFGMAIDTIFLCFCDDQQRNNGADRPYYSSKNLQKFMSSRMKKSKQDDNQPTSSAGAVTPNVSRSKERYSTKVKRFRTKVSPSYTRTNIPIALSTQPSNHKVRELPGHPFQM